MSFIKISNRSDNVNRLFLEKLGISTKRDNDDAIGQFGSGSKFAPIAALRKGWQWINVGSDDRGDYQMEYVIVEEDGIECIHYSYGDYVKPSSFTVDAGVLSWEDAFQIFREAFSNALDAHIMDGAEYTVDIVDEVKFEPGWFSVYLTATDELIEIKDNLDHYFCLDRQPIGVSSDLTFFEPISPSPGRFYYKSVLVSDNWSEEEADSISSIFDYECGKITLNEERRIRHTGDVTTKICHAVNNLRADNEGHRRIAKKLIANINHVKSELTLSTWSLHSIWTYDESALYVEFVEAYGKDTVVITPEQGMFASSLQVHNKRPLTIHDDFMYTILINAGVTDLKMALGDEAEFDFVETLARDEEENLQRAMEIVYEFDHRIDSYPVRIFVPRDGQDGILGVAAKTRDENDMIREMIYISTQNLHSVQELVSTLVHELDHHVTRLRDEDYREFRHVADVRIGQLLMENAELNDMYNALALKMEG